MFDRSKRMLSAGLLVLATAAALAVSGSVTAAAVPPNSVNLKPEWDMYQRLSNTTDNPVGFHVSVDDDPTTDKANTTVSFTGLANTTSSWGRIEEGRIQGRS